MAEPTLSMVLDIVDAQEREHMADLTEHYATLDRQTARIAELEAALRKINALIDSPSRFNADVQAVLDSVIDTSDVKFDQQ